MNANIHIFDRTLVKKRRNRSAHTIYGHDFLIRLAEQRLLERMKEDITHPVKDALILGSREGLLAKGLEIENLYQADLSEQFLARNDGACFCADEEFLPVKPECVDAVLSPLTMHWVNDFPGMLVQMKQALNEKGFVLLNLLGGHTLTELRHVISQVESEAREGISPRISPFMDVKDGAALLQRTGYHLPVSDSEVITVQYNHVNDLLKDLKAMGESNALIERDKRHPGKAFFEQVNARYHALFADENGKIPVTFELITLTGWKN
jgi:SAM-dependent methyltransferase